MCVVEAAIAAAVVGTAVTVKGQMDAGKAAASAYSQNAQTATFQAEDRKEAAEIEVAKSYRTFRRTLGAARAEAGASGLSAESFGDLFADSAAEGAVERMSIRYTAGKEGFYLNRQADQQLAQGRAEAGAVPWAVAGTVAKGVGTIAGMKASPSVNVGSSPFSLR